MGRVLSRGWDIGRRTWSGVGLFTLIFVAANIAATVWLGERLEADLKSATETDSPGRLAIFRSWAYWLTLISPMLFGAILASGSMSGLLRAAQVGSSNIGDCVVGAARHFLPVLAIYVLWMLGLILGFLFLIVPGIFLLTMWSIVIPVRLGEGAGISAAFGRSNHLTEGFRTKVLAIIIIIAIIQYGSLFFLMKAFIGGSIFEGVAGLKSDAAYQWSLIPLTTITTIVLNALLVSTYLECIESKEGGNRSELAKVFH